MKTLTGHSGYLFAGDQEHGENIMELTQVLDPTGDLGEPRYSGAAPSRFTPITTAAGTAARLAGFTEIVGQSAALREVLEQIEMVGPTDSTVLLLGETGTGKELIARAIHERSPRKQRTLVKINCSAIPSGLLESELFGHERGAFTGATTQKIGRIEMADQGTLFLDEIGDIPLELQPKLLRVLQEREFERLGSTLTRKVNVRVVAATHRDLQEMILEKQFRSDLYYRLNVFPVFIPPLRERPEDIPPLVTHFVHEFARRMNKTIDAISSRAMDALIQYPWPGNIRELQNVIERSVIVHQKGELSVRQSCLSLASLHRAATPAPFRRSTAEDREMIDAALAQTEGRVSGPSGAAAILGIPASTLESKIRSLNINKHSFKMGSVTSNRPTEVHRGLREFTNRLNLCDDSA